MGCCFSTETKQNIPLSNVPPPIRRQNAQINLIHFDFKDFHNKKFMKIYFLSDNFPTLTICSSVSYLTKKNLFCK